MIQYGMNINPVDNKQENRYWENSWLDNIMESLEKRGITIKNSINISKVVTLNSTIMEYTKCIAFIIGLYLKLTSTVQYKNEIEEVVDIEKKHIKILKEQVYEKMFH